MLKIRPIEFELSVRRSGKTTRMLHRAMMHISMTGKGVTFVLINRNMARYVLDQLVKIYGSQATSVNHLFEFLASSPFGTRNEYHEIHRRVIAGRLVLFDDFDSNEIITPIVDGCYYVTSVHYSAKGQSKKHREVINQLQIVSYIKHRYGSPSFSPDQLA